jgi:DNA-binding NarL/FixJ family response regulator
LILLDIGLPKLNGIDAARRISQISPQSKIIFVSSEFSAEIIETRWQQALVVMSSRWMPEESY